MSVGQVLLERVAFVLGMILGSWRLEARFEDGRLREVYRHEERIPPWRLDAMADDSAPAA